MNWLFLAVAVIVICFAVYGYKKGIIKIVFSVGSLIVSIILSGVLTSYLNTYLKDNTGLYEAVSNKCQEFIDKKQEMQAVGPEVLEIKETDIEALIREQHLPDSLKESIAKNALREQVDSVQAAVADGIAELVVSAISFMIVLVVIRIILWVVFRVLNVATKLPVIHGANQIAGLAFGILEGLLAVWVFFIFLTCILQTSFGQTCMKMIAGSQFLSYLYNYNLLTLIFH